MGNTKIGVIFSHRPSEEATWPYKGFDYKKRIKWLQIFLKESMPDVEFVFQIANNKGEIERNLEILKNEKVVGLVNYFIGIWTNEDEPTLVAKANLPTILIDDLYGGTGEFLLSLSEAKKENLNTIGIASSNLNDVVNALKLLKVINKMKETKILNITDNRISGVNPAAGFDKISYITKIKEIFGTEISMMDSNEFNSYYSKTNISEAKDLADKWEKESLRVVEPSNEEIIKSARMYLALKKSMEVKGAQAVTMDCLNLVYGKKVPAYPCLSHFQMNNDGLTGVCESDIDSTLTQLMVRYLNGRPGFVSDPVINTAANQIIYAHCVATNKVFGPFGSSNEYIIRSHAEDREGASIQSLLPIGEIVTTAKLSVIEKALAIHQGLTVANIESEKGCRTKLAVETNAKRILNNWNLKHNFGWHRVTFYGDIRNELIQLSTLLGLDVFEEDK